MAICMGCGLRDDGADGAEVATSEIWGSGALAGFGVTDTVGAPVYCDSNGELRTIPEHTSQVVGQSISASINTAFGGSDANGSSASIILNNPSAVRAVSVLIVYSVKFGFQCAAAGFALYANANDGADLGDTIAKTWGVPVCPDAYEMEDEITESYVNTIAAGGSLTLKITPRIVANSGSGVFRAQGVGLRAMMVTR